MRLAPFLSGLISRCPPPSSLPFAERLFRQRLRRLTPGAVDDGALGIVGVAQQQGCHPLVMQPLVGKFAAIGVMCQPAGIGDGGIHEEGMYLEGGGWHQEADDGQAVQLLMDLVPGKALAHLVRGIHGELRIGRAPGLDVEMKGIQLAGRQPLPHLLERGRATRQLHACQQRQRPFPHSQPLIRCPGCQPNERSRCTSNSMKPTLSSPSSTRALAGLPVRS